MLAKAIEHVEQQQTLHLNNLATRTALKLFIIIANNGPLKLQ